MEEKMYMNIETGSVDTRDGWWYDTEDSEHVNAVDRGEVVEVIKVADGQWMQSDMGCTSEQAMAELGVAHPTITKHARALGIKRRGRDYLFSAADLERMRQSIAGAKPGRPKATG